MLAAAFVLGLALSMAALIFSLIAVLAARARDGDREALEQLVIRHQRWIYNLVLRMVYLPQDAEDATQEILVKVITHLATFQAYPPKRVMGLRAPVPGAPAPPT